jgi:hypothetical protein
MGEVIMRSFVFSLAAIVVFSAPAAFAQSKSKQADDNYGYRFDDDHMIGDTLSTTPPLIKVRRPAARVQLIRARASFVAEMLKSVEAL